MSFAHSPRLPDKQLQRAVTDKVPIHATYEDTRA
jgi:hypothetical protein